MEENQVIIEQQPEEDVFWFGDDSISSSELNKLLLSKNLDDKETLKLIVTEAATTKNYEIIIFLLNQGYQLEILNDKNHTLTHLAYYSEIHSTFFRSSNLMFANCENYKNYIDSNGLSHFHIACATNQVDVVRKYLDNGEDIHSRLISDCNEDRSGFTPLHFAVAHHQIEVVQLLLERKANINAVDSLGNTPVHLACSVSCDFKKFENTESLIDHPRWAAELDILRLLLEHNSDSSLRDHDGNTPLLKTFKNNYYDCKFTTYEITNRHLEKERLTILLFKRQVNKFVILMEFGADVTVKNYSDENIMHRIIADSRFTRFSSFPTDRTYNDDTYAEIIKFMLEKNKELDVNAKNKNGETPIELAVSLINFKVFSILLNNNADFSSIKIYSRHFFRYPKAMPSTDVVANLISIITTLIDKGFNLTLDENLTIMKFLAHFDDDVDCDCELVIRGCPALMGNIYEMLYYGSSTHTARVMMKLVSESSNEEFMKQLIFSIQAHVVYCNLIPYPLAIDKTVLEMLPNDSGAINFQMLLENGKELVTLMKSTSFKDEWSCYDFVTKFSQYSSILRFGKNIDKIIWAINTQEQELNQFLMSGHLTKLSIRMYIETSARKNYISFLLPSLPDLCRKLVLEYLDNEDIVKLCEAALLD